MALGFTCGAAPDGCGGTLQCGTCPSTEYCGGGGFNKCGGSTGLAPDGAVPCAPQSCMSLGYTCGAAGDGCGGSLMCGSCQAPQYCGGGGFNKCGGIAGVAPDGATLCVPRSCAAQNFNCGPAGDGCGNELQCGSCSNSDTCGGGGVPGQCGNSSCTGLCLQQPRCDGGATTTITGRVVAGTLQTYGPPDPVPNVIVYVPNAPLSAFKPGVQCSQCGAEVTGNPLVSATTNYDGTFSLSNMPTGSNIPLVIQLGRWRRQVQVSVPACTTTAVGDIHLPRNQSEGNIPLTAISTGAVDSIECVLLKMGVDAAEFTPSSGQGRVHLYSSPNDYTSGQPGYGAGATAGSGTLAEAALMGSGGTFMNYDQILLPCWGHRMTKTATELGNLVSYANAGGHFFATHFSYSWLYQNNPFNTTAKWNVDYTSIDGPITANVQLPPTNPKGTTFSKWLGVVGALSQASPPQVSIAYPRHDVDSVNSPSVDWIDTTDNTHSGGRRPMPATPWLLHYTFDTPVGATNQCGHVIYSDFHVANAATSPSVTFPTECDKNPLTAQERVLEFMIWDLASCVGAPAPPKCTPLSCQAQNISCGPAGDGCGNLLQCGPCTAPQTCGGGGVPGQCGAPDGGSCMPQTCQQQGINCGPAGDGCGNPLTCGTCMAPQTCGGGGVPGQCGYPDGGSCAPSSCSQQRITCGSTSDGCGNVLQCGTCTPPQTCGGGGVPGQCGGGGGSCSPQTCAQQGIQCGPASDGCGNLLQCGTCTPPMTCGGSGRSGQCGGIQ
jgi:hypothetical protein